MNGPRDTYKMMITMIIEFMLGYTVMMLPYCCTAWSTNLPHSQSTTPRTLAVDIATSIRPTRHRVLLQEASSRREFTSKTVAAFLAVVSSSVVDVAVVPNNPLPISNAIVHAVAAAEGNVFADKNFSVSDARTRFQAARKDLRYLVENYADISKGGGDVVRNYLGTQGVSSNLYGIQKVLKVLQDEADDVIEYTEAMDEFNAYYYQAEGAAYQSLFVEHSSAKGTPESFLKTAERDLQQMEKYMDIVAAQLSNGL